MHGWIVRASLIGAVVASMGMMVGTAFSNPATPALKGKYTVLEKEQSTHTPGKVKIPPVGLNPDFPFTLDLRNV